MSKSRKKPRRNPLVTAFQLLVLLPSFGFALYFAALQFWPGVPSALVDRACFACRALTIYGQVLIFLGLLLLAAIVLFVAIAAFTSWLDRLGLLEDIVISILLIALLPLGALVTYLLFPGPAAAWRTWVDAALCARCLS